MVRKGIGIALLLGWVMLALASCGGATKTVTAAATIEAPPQETAAEKKQAAAKARAEEIKQHREEGHERHVEALERRAEERKEAAEKRREGAERAEEEQKERAEEGEHEYSADVQHNFLITCKASGASESNCKCFLKGVEKRLTEEELEALEQAAAGGVGKDALTSSTKVKAAAAECG